MEEAVRPAAAPDLDAIATLYRQATAELRDERGGDVWARETARPDDQAAVVALLEAAVADEHAALLAGTIDDAVVAYALVRARPLADGSTLGHLSDVYVAPEAREVSVGELLLDAVLAWASERGCFGVDSVALPGMRESKNFFESAGLVARAIVVHKRLG